jgi:hypothetical protein
MRSALARSPRRSPSAPTTIDFPAPVSPDSTLKPRASGSVSDSMIAKFRMRSSVSMQGGTSSFGRAGREPGPRHAEPQ